MRLGARREKQTVVREVGAYARRLTLVGVGLLVFLGACLAKVGYLQLVKGSELLEEANQHVQDVMPFYAKRGRILDRNGKILAMTVETRGIQVHRTAVKHPDYVVDYIAGILSMDRAQASKRALCKSRYCYVERFVDPKIAEPLEAILNYKGDDKQTLWLKEMLSGVQVVRAAGRLYPFGERAGQVVGIARVPGPRKDKKLPSPMELEGQYGIEKACDDLLAGKPILQKGLKRQNQGLSLYADNPELVLAGNSVVLSLDVNIQKIAEEELQRSVISSLARRGIAMVMDVRTGELQAVAHYPPFNPNGTRQYRGEELWKWNDAAFIEMFEPGSILKPLIIAAALQEGVITMDDLIFCENGSWKVEKREKPIKDHGRFGFLTVWDIIKYSSNIGSGKIGLRLGSGKLFEYLKAFGFGARTGVKPNNKEAPGMINKRGKGWSDMEIVNISFGQGIAVSPIQMLAAFASLGNGGRLMKPILVKEVLDSNGKTLSRSEPEVRTQLVDEKVATQVIEAMRRVLESGGTGEKANVYGFDACGKTGTAQKIMTIEEPDFIPEEEGDRPKRRGVYVDKWIGSFIGLVPAQDPHLAILVLIDEPYLNDFGGVVAAPVFSRIASRALSYLHVIPSKEMRHTADEQPKIVLHAEKEADVPQVERDLTPRNVGPSVVPDFAGLSVSQCLQVAIASRIKISATGTGVAISQDLAASRVIEEWSTVKVTFGDVGDLVEIVEEQL